MHIVCFWFCLLHSKLESVGHCLWGKQHHDEIHSTRFLEMAYYTAGIHSRISNMTMFGRQLEETAEGFEKGWLNPIVITKLQQFGSLNQIVWIRKEL